MPRLRALCIGVAILAAHAHLHASTHMGAQIDGIPPIASDQAWAGKTLAFLRAALQPLGCDATEAFLAGASGDAFIFTYLDAPVDEQQRDHWPLDVFAAAAEPIGYEVDWFTNQPMDQVRERVRREIDAGAPLLTHSLDPRTHFFQIIVGYDYDSDVFLVQGVDRLYAEGGYAEIDIPDGWSGAVPGEVFWARNPIGVVRRRDGKRASDPGQTARSALHRAIGLWEQESFGFSDYTEEGDWASWASGLPLHEMQQPLGAAAYDALIRDVLNAKEITGGMIWRLDEQFVVRRYRHVDAANYLREVAPLFATADGDTLRAVAERFEKTAEDGATFYSMYWGSALTDDPPQSPTELRQRMDAAPNLVLGIPDSIEDAAFEQWDDCRVMRHPWGRIVIIDTPERRAHAAGLARALKAHGAESVEMLRSVVGDRRRAIGLRSAFRRDRLDDPPPLRRESR